MKVLVLPPGFGDADRPLAVRVDTDLDSALELIRFWARESSPEERAELRLFEITEEAFAALEEC